MPDWKAIHATCNTIAGQLRSASALEWLFPILTVLGPGILGYYGLQGIIKQRTITGFRFDQRLMAQQVTGGPALAVGVGQLLLAAALFALLAPLSASLLGWW